MKTKQTELGLDNQNRNVAPGRRPTRRTRARWWFAQMRALVDAAPDWKPTDEQEDETPNRRAA